MGAQPAVQAAYAALSAIQSLPAGQQVAGIFLLARAVAQQLGLDLSVEIHCADRRLKDANTFHNREAQALSDYVNGELA